MTWRRCALAYRLLILPLKKTAWRTLPSESATRSVQLQVSYPRTAVGYRLFPEHSPGRFVLRCLIKVAYYPRAPRGFFYVVLDTPDAVPTSLPLREAYCKPMIPLISFSKMATRPDGEKVNPSVLPGVCTSSGSAVVRILPAIQYGQIRNSKRRSAAYLKPSNAASSTSRRWIAV